MSGYGLFVFLFGLTFAASGLCLFLGHAGELDRNPKSRVWLLVLVVGSVAVTADLRSRAVGSGAADALWLGLTAIVTAVAAFRCPFARLGWPVAAVSGAALFVVVNDGPVQHPFGLVVLPAVSVGAWLSLRSVPVQRVAPRTFLPVRAGLALTVTRSLLTIPTSLPARVPSVLAGLSIFVMALGFYGSSSSFTRKVLRHVVRLAAITSVSLTFITGISLGFASLHARAALHRIDALRSVAAAQSDQSILSGVEAVQRSLTATARWLDNPLLAPAANIPGLAPNIRLARRASRQTVLGATAALRASKAVNLMGPKFRTGFRSSDFNDLERDLTVVHGSLLSLASLANPRSRSIRSTWIFQPLIRTLKTYEPDLWSAASKARSLAGRMPIVADLLGARGSRRYLLVLPTPAEARGSGGVIGNYGEILTTNEGIRLTRFGRAIDLATEGVAAGRRVLKAPPDFVARYGVFGVASTWSNLTLSPDFPSAAEAMANLYPQSGGSAVDGVISADPIALEAILSVVGPIRSGMWPTPLTNANVASVLLYESYVRLGGDSIERRDLLSDVSNAVWSGLGRIKPSSVLQARARLRDSLDGRHLQIWMRRSAEQAQMLAIGVSGAVPAVAGDSFGVVVNNATASKLEWYLHRSVEYLVDYDTVTGATTADATVVLRNDADPASADPDYVIGNSVPDITVPRGTSRLYVSVYSVLSLESWTVDGKPVDLRDTTTELARRVSSAWVLIPSRSELTMRIRFRGTLPPDGYQLGVFRQPLVHADQLRVGVTLNRPMSGGGRFAGIESRSKSVSLDSSSAVEFFSVHSKG